MVKSQDILRAWGRILRGDQPALSIEVTKECPLRCPGCYAFDAGHLGGGTVLRELHDRRGDELVAGVLEIVDRLRPLHLSLVGGDPLVRYRELERLLPQLVARGVFVQVVTSAFRPIPAAWAAMPKVEVVVSVDGLQPEHDARRAPATYSRILRHIHGQHAVVHCTITGQMTTRADYLESFVRFWSGNADVKKIWMSIFTPQLGAAAPEIPTPEQRAWIIGELHRLRLAYPRLDMRHGLIEEFRHPPASPQECIFAQVTRTISADLTTPITPCQFGGQPDCARCGCIASMGLAAVGHHHLPGGIPVGGLFRLSAAIGRRRRAGGTAQA
ncbi:MAG: radical SAM protein [Terriglobales bacterium]